MFIFDTSDVQKCFSWALILFIVSSSRSLKYSLDVLLKDFLWSLDLPSSILVYHFLKDDVTHAFWKKLGLVILDWYFGEGMDNNSAAEKDKKEGKDISVFVRLPIYCVYT